MSHLCKYVIQFFSHSTDYLRKSFKYLKKNLHSHPIPAHKLNGSFSYCYYDIQTSWGKKHSLVFNFSMVSIYINILINILYIPIHINILWAQLFCVAVRDLTVALVVQQISSITGKVQLTHP